MLKIKSAYGVEELARSDYPVLWDTSAISSAWGVTMEGKNFLEKANIAIERGKFSRLMQEIVTESNFCITKKVLNELLVGGYKYSKKIKEAGLSVKRDEKRDLLELRRRIREENKLRRSLVSLFEEEGRVLDLSKEPDYKRFNWKYGHFKVKGSLGEHVLSDTDLDSLINGLIVAKREGEISFVANDKGIFRAGIIMAEDEGIQEKDFRFFTRTGVSRLTIMKY